MYVIQVLHLIYRSNRVLVQSDMMLAATMEAISD